MCDGLREKVSEAVVIVRTGVAITEGGQPNQLRKIVSEFRKGAVLEIILRGFYVHAFEGPTHTIASYTDDRGALKLYSSAVLTLWGNESEGSIEPAAPGWSSAVR